MHDRPDGDGDDIGAGNEPRRSSARRLAEPDRRPTALLTEGVPRHQTTVYDDDDAQDTDELPRGTSLGRYIVEDEIGRGGMGRVYSAWDPEIDRRVAVKVLNKTSRTSGSILARFLREAKITGQLEHPNIAPVHDIGMTEDNLPFIVMKRIQGRTLAAVLRDLRNGEANSVRAWSRFRLLQVFLQVCSAVDYAHSRNVVHRDLKPANVMLGAFNVVQVLDWGVAALLTGNPDAARVIVGTPGYMAPEQMSGSFAPDHRADIWSLGAILFELLTRRPAFPGRTRESIAARVAEGPDFDNTGGESIPEVLKTICLTALAADRDQRYDSVHAMMEELQAFLDLAQRKSQATAFVAEARRSWLRYGELRRQLREMKPAGGEEEPSATAEREALEGERTHRFSQAIAACERALSLDPENAEARAIMAEAAGSVYRRLRG